MTRAGIWGVREATGLTDLAGQTRVHGQRRALALRRVSLSGAVDRGVERTRGGPSRNRLIAWESTGGQPRLAWPPACLLTPPPRGGFRRAFMSPSGGQRGNERTVARPVRGQVYPPGGDQDEAQCDSQLRPSPLLTRYPSTHDLPSCPCDHQQSALPLSVCGVRILPRCRHRMWL